MKYLLALLALVLFGAGVVSAQEQLGATFKEKARIRGDYAQAQLILCKNDDPNNGSSIDSVAGSGSLAATGEWCNQSWADHPNNPGNDPNGVEGDWSKGFWAGGYDCIHMHFEEFGAGSAQAKVWNCHLPITDTWNTATQAPDPAVAPAPSLTNDRECEELTLGTTLDGQTTRYVTECEAALGMIFGEIDNCTDDCSSRLSVSAGH